MHHLHFAALSLAVLCGCFSVGRQIDMAAVDQIKEGQTTKADLKKLLGSPDSMGRDPWLGRSSAGIAPSIGAQVEEVAGDVHLLKTQCVGM